MPVVLSSFEWSGWDWDVSQILRNWKVTMSIAILVEYEHPERYNPTDVVANINRLMVGDEQKKDQNGWGVFFFFCGCCLTWIYVRNSTS